MYPCTDSWICRLCCRIIHQTAFERGDGPAFRVWSGYVEVTACTCIVVDVTEHTGLSVASSSVGSACIDIVESAGMAKCGFCCCATLL